MATESFDHFYKLLLIGDQYTGKTALLRRFTEDKFQTSYLHTIGIDFKIRTVELHGQKIRLQLWDTAGQERFRSITSTYYRGAQGVVLVYDIADRNSFVNIRNWFNDIRQYGAANVEKILVGNKSDLVESRLVLEEEGRQLASVIGARFIEASAKSGVNVERLFLTLVSDITARKYSSAAMRGDSSHNSSGASMGSGAAGGFRSPNTSFNAFNAGNTMPSNHQQFRNQQQLQQQQQQLRQNPYNSPGMGPNHIPSILQSTTYNPFQVGAGNTLKSKSGPMLEYSPHHRNTCCRYY